MLTAEAADEPDAEPTLAAATEVQRLDVAAMHEKALGILATLKASGVALAKKNVLSFFVDVVYTNPSNKQQMPRPAAGALPRPGPAAPGP